MKNYPTLVGHTVDFMLGTTLVRCMYHVRRMEKERHLLFMPLLKNQLKTTSGFGLASSSRRSLTRLANVVAAVVNSFIHFLIRTSVFFISLFT